MESKDSLWRRIQIRNRPVKQNVLFYRFFSVVIVTILMTALFTTLIYTVISRTIFRELKEEEMLIKARALGDLIMDEAIAFDDRILLYQLIDVTEHSDSLLGSNILVADGEGNIQFYSQSLNAESQDFQDIIHSAIDSILQGNEIRTNQVKAFKGSNWVLIGTPIQNETGIYGAIMMLVPAFETMVAMGSLNGALVLSLVLSLPIVAILVYWAISLIVKPLRQMRDVALKMAEGNFTACADDSQRGEIGQLGRSLNFLSRALNRSVSELTLERNRLQQILDGLSEGIVAVDRSLRITNTNPALELLFAKEKIDSDDEKLALIPYPEIWDDFQSVVKNGEAANSQIILGDRVIEVSIAPLHDEDAAVPGAVGLFRDITESERLERTRRDYVANVSHEMRTPLTAMRGLIEPLSDGMVKSEETRSRYYSILMRETMRLSRLIDDLMELSRLQSGALALNMQVMDVAMIMEDILNKYTQTAEEHDLSFTVTDAALHCPTVYSNPDRIEQILVILVDNAMKYTPEGGHITVDAGWNDKRVTVWVRDSGVGIAEADQPYIFDRFYKVDKAHSGLGSGLGLSIASELLRWMGEEIWLESKEGEGSGFFFTIKRPPDATDDTH